MIVIPALLDSHLREIELGGKYFNSSHLAGELSRLAGDPEQLSESERLGCFAEIICWQFMPIRSVDRQPWGSYFGPMFSGTTENGDPFHKPDAKIIPKRVIEHWVRRSAQSPHPLIKARHADLAWEISNIWNREHPSEKIERPRELAQRAIDAYVQAASGRISGEDHYVWQHLGRALELALLVKDEIRTNIAKDAAFNYTRSCQDKPQTHHWWDLHHLLWETKGLSLTNTERDELIDWIGQALAKHTDPHSSENFDHLWAADAAETLRLWWFKLGHPEKGTEAIKQAGQAIESVAEKSDAITGIAWLEDLSVKYRRDNLLDDVARVEASIRSKAQAAENAMTRQGCAVDLPSEKIEVLLKEMMGDSLDMALVRIALDFIHSEDELQTFIKQMATQTPLQANIPISIIGPHGFTVARIGSTSDDMPGRIMHLASTLIDHEALWLNWALERAKRDRQLEAKSLFSWFVQSPLFAPLGHGLLRQGLAAWETGDFAKAVHLLVPQVESAIREWMTVLGESPMRLDTNNGGFESKGLGEMLHSKTMRENLNPALRHHLRCLYTHSKGINLRNRIAHGWAGEELVGRGMANWVLHSLMALRVHAHMKDNHLSEH